MTESPSFPWDSDNRLVLRTFLDSDTGHRLLALLDGLSPGFEDGSDQGKTLVAAGKVEGWQSAVEWITRLRTEESPTKELETRSEYDDIDDDKAWAWLEKKMGDKRP